MNIRHITVSCLVALLLGSGPASCAPVSDGADWALSTDAQATYGVLMLDQSLRSGDIDGILEAAGALLASGQDHTTDLIGAGTALLMGNEAASAKMLMEQCASARPDNLPFHMLLSEACFTLSQSDQGVSVMQDFAKSHPDSVAARQELGLALYKADRYVEAESVFKGLPEAARTPFINTCFGHLLLIRKQLPEAERCLMLGLRGGFVPDPRLAASLASQMLDLGATGLADRYMTAVHVKTDPPSALVTTLAAAAAFENKRPDRALQLLETISEDDEESKTGAFLHAHILNEIGFRLVIQPADPAALRQNLKKAIPMLEKAVKLAPDNAFIIDSLAWAYFRNGEAGRAYPLMKQAIAFPDGEDEAELWRHLADIAGALGKTDEAALARDRAASLTRKPKEH